MLPNSTTRALKEWAVVVRALEAGEQLVILRKGGISEVGNEFRIEFPDFLFYPTYEHQKPDSLLSAFEPALERSQHEAPAGNLVRIGSFARVTDSFDILSESQLTALRPYHIWSDGYALERLHWRPTKPLAALALRVYKLPSEVELPFRPTYRGCTSWVTLEQDIALAGAKPVVSDDEYGQRIGKLRAALSDLGVLVGQPS
jgi:hypothetical protein